MPSRKRLTRTIAVAVPLMVALLGACSDAKKPPRTAKADGMVPMEHDAGRTGRSDAPVADTGSGAGSDSGTIPTAPRSRARVFFSGHSLLDNPIPDWVESIARARGEDYGWEQQIIIGSPIRARTHGPGPTDYDGFREGKDKRGQDTRGVMEELASPTSIGSSERYDTLVITERHDILDVTQWEGTIPHLRHYHDQLRKHLPSARTLFYQSWPNIDRSNPQEWIDYQAKETLAWECAASKVNHSLAANGFPRAVTVVPVGPALAVMLERALADQIPGISGSTTDKLNEVFTDDVHLNDYGRYLASAVTYAAIFGKSPVGAHAVPEVPAATANALEEIAWQVVSEYEKRKEAGASRPMEECRTKVTSPLCPEYFEIRDRELDCGYWTKSDSPYAWPDSTLPLHP